MADGAADVRSALLAAAEGQLEASAGGEISTRAVCAAVGVTQPVLYRAFGDKQGLLDALSGVGFDRYAQRKSELTVSSDPLADLYAGWDDHLAFADEHPALYRLMFGAGSRTSSRARAGVLELLSKALQRCVAIGALQMPVAVAAPIILAANVGLALNRLAEPAVYADAALSEVLRNLLFGALLTEPIAGVREASPIGTAAAMLAAKIDQSEHPVLLPAEQTLMRLWLDRMI